jgi:hypothetical protein
MRRTFLTAALFLAACTNNPNSQQEGARLMALMKVASGGAALDKPSGFHETGTALRDGMAATYETWGDLRSLKSVSHNKVGDMTMASGFDGSTSWSMGPGGEVEIDTSATGVSGARLGTYLTTAAYFYPDRFPARFEYAGPKEAEGETYDVITVTPEGSTPVDLWLDRSTHLLERISGMDGDTPFSGRVVRYEAVDGALIAFELHQKQGEHALELKLTSYAFETIPPERFAPPAQ